MHIGTCDLANIAVKDFSEDANVQMCKDSLNIVLDSCMYHSIRPGDNHKRKQLLSIFLYA